MVDIIIVGLLMAYCVYVLYKEYKRKQIEKCTGICTGCGSTSCHVDYEKMMKEIREKEFSESRG